MYLKKFRSITLVIICFSAWFGIITNATATRHKHHAAANTNPNAPATSKLNVPVTGTNVPTQFDQHFVSFMRRWRVPGASVAIIRNGQLVFSHGYGFADLQTRQPVLPNSLFRIGSVSKAITSVTVLKLVEQGRLNLNDSAFRILNDVTPLNNRHNPAIYDITVRNLLQMASGWTTNVMDPMFGPWTAGMMNQLQDSNLDLPPDCMVAARMMMGTPLQSRPGTRYSYSNLNYCLLGMLANKVTGNPYNYLTYQTLVQQTVLAPLGITDMHIGDTLPQNRDPNEVHYYNFNNISDPEDILNNLARIDGLPYSNSQILKKNYADGGWLASAPDLAKFLNAVATHRILSARMVNIMLETPTYVNSNKRTDDYFAMGWSVKHVGNQVYWYKTGSFTGTYAFIMQGSNGTSYAAIFNTKPYQRVAFIAQLRRLLLTSAS